MTDHLPVNFLYLGGDKCGSTWIYRILSQHPDVCLSTSKELFYFDRFYDKGADWYARQFKTSPQALRTGEVCHDYLYSERALERIARDLPADARFLVTVRNPVERTLSHYKYLLKIGRTQDPFDKAIHSQPQIVEHSMFGKHIARAASILGHDRVHVVPFEVLKSDPVLFGKAIAAALDIRFVPDLTYSETVLAAQSARAPKMVRLLRDTGWLLRRFGAQRLVGQLKSNQLVQRALFKNDTSRLTARSLAPGLSAQLTNVFAADQDHLHALLAYLPRARI